VDETKRIGHYRVIDELGRGGMGVVYKAEDTRLGRLVALKCFSPTRISDAESLHRFAREARATCATNDPHVPTIYDIGEADGIHFISSELIPGITLREQLRQPLGLARTLEVAKQILQALSAAHEHGVIHRDLKPENIMIRPDGHVKVLDFGIAAIGSRSRLNEFEAGSAETLTETGRVVGTMAYMSPEQALGRTLDASSDLFSFGVVLYEMLAGEHPWKRGSAIDMLHAIVHDPTPELPPSIEYRPELQALIEKTLRKNPSERYQSADALLRDCERLGRLNGRHSAARPDTQNSLAVLPFVFLSQVEEKESLSLGFADAVITSLGNLEDFVVLPTSTILKYTGGADPGAVSQELGVRNVLQGNIQKLGQRWRVTLQLYDADARKTVFASKLDFSLADIFDIQDQISERVAESLSAKFRSRPAKARDRYSTDPNAYDEYLQGLKDSYSDTIATMDNALGHLSRAVERDPDFALAHAALARVLADKYRIYDSRRSIGEGAEYHARRALALDADLAEGHLARALRFLDAAKELSGTRSHCRIVKGSVAPAVMLVANTR
jgi:TolB-like protein